MPATIETLMDAVKARDTARVRAILEERHELAGARAASGESPILEALYRGARDIVDLLAARTPLDVHEAAALGDLTRVRELVDADPSVVHTHSADGWTPLHLAAFFGHAAVAELLVERGADLGAVSDNYMANTPLHAALAGAEDAATVGVLLEHGAHVNAAAATAITPLHTAASRGNLPFIGRLLERGADPFARMVDGKTPADLAAERGHPEASELLTQRTS